MRGHSRGPRGGFTLIEMLIAMTVFGIVVAGALGFMSAQNRAFHLGSQRMAALTNLQFAMQMLEADVPMLGTNLVSGQPGLVYAGRGTLAFNADLVTNAANDPFAVYFDPDAPTGQVTSPQRALTLPLTGGTSWPATPFTTAAGTPAPAELIQYGFYHDDQTARDDDFVLGRRVNGGGWEVVARNLLAPTGGDPFFRYVIHRAYPGAPTELDSIPDADLPATHADFIADSVRAVRVTLRSTNGLSGDSEQVAEMSRLISMPNAGIRRPSTCGDEPIMTAAVTALPGLDASGDPVVTVTWGPSVDDGAGENDVQRYVIWRRNTTLGAPFQDPLVSVPVGTGNIYVDAEVDQGMSYQYQVAAQDCTPAISAVSTSLAAVIP